VTRAEPEERAPSSEQPRGAVVELNQGRVLVGTCSWTDKTLTGETDWYPRRTMTAADRLRFYTSRFPLVEVDSTYYAPPSRQQAALWAERSPRGFRFNIKAYSLLTGHPTRPNSLWPDLREQLRPEAQGKKNLYSTHLEPDALEEAWRRFGEAVQPLAEAGKLGGILFQYPQWFTPRRDNREELERLRERLPDYLVCVEFRAPAWLAEPHDRERTLGLLEDLGLVFVGIDAPRASGLPRLLATTSDELAVVRLHGRSDRSWKDTSGSAAERFKYLYRKRDLAEIADQAAQIAADVRETHLLMNNCYRDYGVRNAAQLRDLLAERPDAALV
jgi:uncharacterized protein YecE (DUF72 family)